MGVMKSEVIIGIINAFLKRKGVFYNHNELSNNNPQQKRKNIVESALFVLFAVSSIAFFIVLGLYDLLVSSPLNVWFSSAWNLIMNISPQAVIDAPKQITVGDGLMQKTIGDWLEFIPGIFEQIAIFLSVLFVPFFGLLLSIIAIVMRLGSHLLNLFSFSGLNKRFTGSLSWVILILSFFPVLKNILICGIIKNMDIKNQNKPWGFFRQYTHNELSTVKLICVKAGSRLSLQYHKNREEFWRVISGNPILVIGKNIIKASSGDEFFIAKEIKHRIEACNKDVYIMEISFGNFDENDIIRVEDDFGRV